MFSSFFLDRLNNAQLLRPVNIPGNVSHVCLIALSRDVQLISALIDKYPHIQPKLLILPDLGKSQTRQVRVSLPDNTNLPVGDLEAATTCPQYEKVFIAPANPAESAAYLTEICRFLSKRGVQQIFIFGEQPPAYSSRTGLADFYERNSRLLEAAFALFNDHGSKALFISRIKSILTGNAGYMPISPHPDYFFPLVKPESGDVMIDGGVSDLVGAQLSFIEGVGEKGRIFGFEPIPRLCESAASQLAAYKNYKMECAGLAKETGSAFFEDLRDSSHIAQENSGGVECKLTSIDDYCAINNINHVDCIKLDVEGAELEALKGAKKTIKKDKPKLIVCLYHKPQDMYEIPLFITRLEPGYELFLSHTSCQFMDTVLYAKFKAF